MKLLEWLKWQIAKKEMAELDRWRIEWHDHRRWFAEFQVTATAFDHLKARVEGEPVTNISTVRDSCRTYLESKG